MKTRVLRPIAASALLFFLILLGPSQGWSGESGEEVRTYSPEKPVTVETFIQEVVERNPDLKKMKNRTLSAREGIEPAGTLPDPVIGISLTNIPVDEFVFSREPMTSKDFFISQKIPFPGKLGLKEEIEKLRSASLEESTESVKVRLAFVARKALFALAETRREREITEKTKVLFKEYLEAARKLYSVGKGRQQDVFRAQTEIFNLDRKLEKLGKREKDLVSLLNTLRSAPVDTPIRVTGLPETGTPVAPLEELVEKAKGENPSYRAQLDKVRMAEKMVRLAEKNLYPDFTLQLRYRQRERRTDYVTGAVALNLPIFAGRKQKKIVKKNEYNLLSAREEARSTLEKIQNDLKEALNSLQDAERELSILRNAVLPEARKTVESALSSYSVGDLEFNSLVRAALQLYKYEIEEARLVMLSRISRAKIKMLTGEI
ncbi:MAG: TolC family protein [Deltaproteobacteria bacterium]|nr:MAG: TolC family protein [Deltaproteobacteria bacterium]